MSPAPKERASALQGEGLGRPRGGFSTKIHLGTNGLGLPVALVLTGGEVNDVKGYGPVMVEPGPEPTVMLADIALNPVERGIDEALGGMPDMKGGVSVTDLSFRYAPYQPMVFEGVSLRIEPGEFVAVTGPSGAGKVAIDDIDIATWGPRILRQNIGVVLQDDELISGSIAENVSFFAETIDMEWVWTCLEMAGIAEDIRSMPMRTETFVGDRGSSFSGGQKQRVLLARAFYRRPKILILDEATSHLDVARERQINDAIKGLEVTRIVIAHRPETIAAADRVLELSGGRISEGSVGTTEAR
jgi:ATP-binding cassette subfamily B protein RaxB